MSQSRYKFDHELTETRECRRLAILTRCRPNRGPENFPPERKNRVAIGFLSMSSSVGMELSPNLFGNRRGKDSKLTERLDLEPEEIYPEFLGLTSFDANARHPLPRISLSAKLKSFWRGWMWKLWAPDASFHRLRSGNVEEPLLPTYKTLFEDLGVRLLFTDFEVGILQFLQVAPSQLHPNRPYLVIDRDDDRKVWTGAGWKGQKTPYGWRWCFPISPYWTLAHFEKEIREYTISVKELSRVEKLVVERLQKFVEEIDVLSRPLKERLANMLVSNQARLLKKREKKTGLQTVTKKSPTIRVDEVQTSLAAEPTLKRQKVDEGGSSKTPQQKSRKDVKKAVTEALVEACIGGGQSQD
ncbi:hypothetical protein SESBI_40223 [Sesbania bispinosa]|nr:hypothetical protein SESBI_40223 [Sesbania bispinosa]